MSKKTKSEKKNKKAKKMKDLVPPYPWARSQAPKLKKADFVVVHLATTGQLFGPKEVPSE